MQNSSEKPIEARGYGATPGQSHTWRVLLLMLLRRGMLQQKEILNLSIADQPGPMLAIITDNSKQPKIGRDINDQEF